MRTLLAFAAAAVLGVTAAHAQAPCFYAERSPWTVYASGSVCRALNRPPEDFNAAPFNALQVVARPGGAISVEVFFWPGVVGEHEGHDIVLDFRGKDTLTLKAASTLGDYTLASVDEPKLWRNLQDASAVDVTVPDAPVVHLHFGLDGMMWVLNALQTCTSMLPKS